MDDCLDEAYMITAVKKYRLHKFIERITGSQNNFKFVNYYTVKRSHLFHNIGKTERNWLMVFLAR